MSVVWEWALTLLAAFGLFSLICLLFGRLMVPVGTPEVSVYLAVRGEGSGRGLEHTVNALAWLRSREGLTCPVLLVDAGLNEEGRALASLLARRWDEVRVCTAEEWTNDFMR